MLELKSLLRENKKQNLLSRLETGNYYGVQTNKRLFRGEKKENVEKFKKLEIRKRGDPKDTAVLVDEVVEAVRKRHFSDIASRQRSLFVTGKSNVARGYGEATYVFVPKSANTWWSPNDAYTDFLFEVEAEFNFMKRWINYKQNTEAGLSSHIVVQFASAVHKENIKEAAKIAADIYKKVINNKIKKDFEELTIRLRKTFVYIQQYFKSLSPYRGEVDSRYVHEILVEGDHVLLVSKDWFNSTIEPELYKQER